MFGIMILWKSAWIWNQPAWDGKRWMSRREASKLPRLEFFRWKTRKRTDWHLRKMRSRKRPQWWQPSGWSLYREFSRGTIISQGRWGNPCFSRDGHIFPLFSLKITIISRGSRPKSNTNLPTLDLGSFLVIYFYFLGNNVRHRGLQLYVL